MTFRCEACSTSCFSDTDPADENNWPVCHNCDDQMVPFDELEHTV